MVAASILLVVFGSMMSVITNEPLELGMSDLSRIDNHHVYRLCACCCKTFMNMATDGDVNLSKPTSYMMHQQVQHSRTVLSAHSEFVCFVFI